MKEATQLNDASRRKFLIAAGTALLAGCAGHTGLVPRFPQNVCPQDVRRFGRTTDLCGAGGGGGTTDYSATGGVNAAAWQNFRQFTTSALVSNGYSNTSSTTAASSYGSNDKVSGALLHNGSLNYQQVTGGTQLSTSISPYAYTSNTYSGNIVLPSAVPTNGTYSAGGCTFTNTSSVYGTIVSMALTVQGVPCTLTITPVDSTAQNYRIDYKNLHSGAVASWSYTLPSSFVSTSSAKRHPEAMSKVGCGLALVGAGALFVFGVALGAAMLPEAAAVGAAYAALGGVATGAQYLSGVIGVLSVPACL